MVLRPTLSNPATPSPSATDTSPPRSDLATSTSTRAGTMAETEVSGATGRQANSRAAMR